MSGSHPAQATDPRDQHGLFRAHLGGSGQPLSELLARRASHATRVHMDRSEGHGAWEFYRLDPDVYVVTGDCLYDTARTELVPGEDLIEFHLRLSGRLELESASGLRISVPPASLLLWCQPRGMTFHERIDGGLRDTSVSLYFRPLALQRRARQNGFRLPDWIRSACGAGHFSYAIRPLTPRLLYLARSLLKIPYENGLRLLHAEAKSLEIFCEIVHSLQGRDRSDHAPDSELCRLDRARRIVTTQFNPVPRAAHIAHTVGMSESNLTRRIKERFDVTLSKMSLECRMRHALDLLRWSDLAVRQVAFAAGYRHHTTFTAAFRRHFGFLPGTAKSE